MEMVNIDWQNIDSRFVKDELYEHINAPKWVDFSAPDASIDDEAWFCRPSCNHPKTVEDFYKRERTSAPNSKHQKSASVSDIPPLGDKIKRDAILKKRGMIQPSALSSNNDATHYKIIEDGENQDPNFTTPVNHKTKFGKEAIKSSAEKKSINDPIMKNERTPKLRSTLSARNLFSGGDILNKVAEFCNDLKKLATRARDRENSNDTEKEGPQDHLVKTIDVLNDKEKERKPLLRRKKRNEDEENTPISVDMENTKDRAATERLLQARTYPPTPQCFSAGQGHSKTTTLKPFRTRPMEEMNRAAAEKDARSLDVFWFLKPCTLSS